MDNPFKPVQFRPETFTFLEPAPLSPKTGLNAYKDIKYQFNNMFYNQTSPSRQLSTNKISSSVFIPPKPLKVQQKVSSKPHDLPISPTSPKNPSKIKIQNPNTDLGLKHSSQKDLQLPYSTQKIIQKRPQSVLKSTSGDEKIVHKV